MKNTSAHPTGRTITIPNSIVFNGDTVLAIECTDASGRRNGTCLRCGRALRRHWWDLEDPTDNTLYGEIGPECIRQLG